MPTRPPSTAELVWRADRNLVDFTRAQALWTQRGEAVLRDDMQLVASSTRFPAGMFNCLQPLDAPPDAARAHRWLDEASAFYAARERGFSVYVRAQRDAALLEACRARGLQPAGDSPGMVLDRPIPEPPVPPGVRIARVTDAQGVADFAAAAAPAYAQLALREAVTLAVFAQAERVLSPELSLFVAYEDGVPAATALTYTSCGIAGLYWVATRPDRQRRGLGELITRRAGNDAFERGASCVILQASRFGELLYKRLGYREITRYVWLYATREQLAGKRPEPA